MYFKETKKTAKKGYSFVNIIYRLNSSVGKMSSLSAGGPGQGFFWFLGRGLQKTPFPIQNMACFFPMLAEIFHTPKEKYFKYSNCDK